MPPGAMLARRTGSWLPRTTSRSSTPSRSCSSRTTGSSWPGRRATGGRRSRSRKSSRPTASSWTSRCPSSTASRRRRQLRAGAPQLPIVAVSGHDYEERVLEIRQAGADDYVRKARMAGGAPARARGLARSEQNADVTEAASLREAGGRTRTDGRRITSEVLYQLSYSGAPPSVAAVTAGLRGPSGARGSCA